MKRFILVFISLVSLSIVSAQSAITPAFPKTIQVTGMAEMIVAPDEIHVIITLKEYEKKGKGKIDINTIRNTFLANVRKTGIADSSIKILSMDGNNGPQWWRKKQQKEELYAAVAYEIIFNNAQKIDELINLLDDDATQNFAVSQTTHSNLVALQRQLRIEALKAAKLKAIYLAEAISEKIGSAITITETTYPQIFDNLKTYANSMSVARDQVGDMTMPEFKKLILKSEMNVVFELK